MGADAGFDYSVYDPSGRRTVLVEVKRRMGTTRAWATELRGNMLARGRLPAADLFLLAVPDRLYIWKMDVPPDAPPTFEIDARPLFAPYFERVGVPPQQLEPVAFEMLVAWWLRDVARSGTTSANPELAQSGLLEAVSDADVVDGAAA
jgi:hypothetical protein